MVAEEPSAWAALVPVVATGDPQAVEGGGTRVSRVQQRTHEKEVRRCMRHGRRARGDQAAVARPSHGRCRAPSVVEHREVISRPRR